MKILRFQSILFILISSVCDAYTVSTLSNLAFGKIAAGSGGSVTVSPAGSRTGAGGITIISSGSGSAARFLIQGPPNQAYILTLPLDNEVVLNSGGNSMQITNFTVSPSTTGNLDSAGDQTVDLGATLNIDSNKPPGDYNGTFLFTINNQ